MPDKSANEKVMDLKYIAGNMYSKASIYSEAVMRIHCSVLLYRM